MNRRLAILLCLIQFTSPTISQERQGMEQSNYLSTSGIFLNPSSSADSRCYMQFNLLDAQSLVSSNMAYIPSFSAWSLVKGNMPQNVVSKNPNGKDYTQVKAEATGPAFVISTMDFGAGIFVRLRSNSIAKGISYDALMQVLDPQSTYHYDYPQELKVKNALIGSMTWAEYGLNYAKMYRLEPNRLLTIGLNLKYLNGIYLNYKFVDHLEAVLNDSTYDVLSIKAKDRYNDPAFPSGKGFSGDFGITYKKMNSAINSYYVNSPRSNCNYIDYKYKLSASLMDLGAIKFNRSTYRGDIDTTLYTSSQEIPITDNLNVQYVTNKAIWAVCPSALVLQGDYNFQNNIYLSALLVKNLIPESVVGAQASNLLCITPRFETRQVEVSLPFTLQRFQYPYLGLAFRLRTFVFGVDNVLPFIVRTNTSHFGVYLKLGLSLFKNPACKTKALSVDDCKPGTKNKRWFGIPKMGDNMKKKRKSGKKFFNWF
ncbi:MAG TPA: DUF5723 family protein [Bacteroidia bacterium]|nr:DUF5723 family protein [Bacteroidia bacterium]